MYFGGFLRPRPGSWPLRMAVRSTLTGITTIIAAVAIESQALPKIEAERDRSVKVQLPAGMEVFNAFRGYLPFVPIPAVIAGAAALALPTFRPPLAVLASVLSLLAMVIVVGTLVTALAPMYQLERSFDLDRQR